MVVTNNWYTPAAHRLADKIGVRLIDRSGLTKYINDLKEGNKDVKRL
jgi:HJR/Mrr/RecB family endonuclease